VGSRGYSAGASRGRLLVRPRPWATQGALGRAVAVVRERRLGLLLAATSARPWQPAIRMRPRTKSFQRGGQTRLLLQTGRRCTLPRRRGSGTHDRHGMLPHACVRARHPAGQGTGSCPGYRSGGSNAQRIPAMESAPERASRRAGVAPGWMPDAGSPPVVPGRGSPPQLTRLSPPQHGNATVAAPGAEMQRWRWAQG